MAISWLNVYDTNVRAIDLQHRKLVDMINDLESAKGSKNESKLLRDLFFKLVDYTKYHFTTEEKLMGDSNYPKLVEHTGQHKQFINKIVEMLEDIKEGNPKITEKLQTFLLKWLIKHILGYDKEFANFYRVASH
jgi:hemerythrin-like metal-binding protein